MTPLDGVTGRAQLRVHVPDHLAPSNPEPFLCFLVAPATSASRDLRASMRYVNDGLRSRSPGATPRCHPEPHLVTHRRPALRRHLDAPVSRWVVTMFVPRREPAARQTRELNCPPDRSQTFHRRVLAVAVPARSAPAPDPAGGHAMTRARASGRPCSSCTFLRGCRRPRGRTTTLGGAPRPHSTRMLGSGAGPPETLNCGLPL